MAKQKKRGMFILVEGISGSGKSTLANTLTLYLKALHKRVILDAEPTRNPIGKGIRKLIDGIRFSHAEMGEFNEFLDIVARALGRYNKREVPELKMYADAFRDALHSISLKITLNAKLTELEYQLLYIADRYLDIELTIIPALELGISVVLDRYDLSTYAYGMSRGLGMLGLSDYHLAALGKHYLIPDVTLFVDVPAEVAAKRLKKSGKTIDRFEKLKSLKAVARAYEDIIALREFACEPLAPLIRVNGNRPKQKVLESALRALKDEGLLPQDKK